MTTVAEARLDKLEQAALCAEIGPEAFFAEDGAATPVSNAIYNRARQVCATCPVRELCLDVALTYERGHDRRRRSGMWGGKTPVERAALDPAVGDEDDSDSWAGEGFTVRDEESTS